MIKYIWYMLLILLIAYSCKTKNTQAVVQNVSISFEGIWAENEEENALFKIKGDTIINVEHGDKMFFRVAHDTMIIDYDGVLGKYLILKHSRDSLILQNEDYSITRLYNRVKY